MANRFGYLADLACASFDESTRTSWIQAAPLGTYMHPVYGRIAITPEKAARLAESVNQGIRGQQLDINYDHNAKTDKAAGWIQKAEARSDGLWVLVEWTKKAYRAIKDKEYKYFSPEFQDEWTHPQTQNVFKDVLFGGGITNRPFLKGILPLNLSELSFTEQPESREESGMDPKLLRKLLGLPEDATDDQVTEAVNKLPDDAVISAPSGESGKEKEEKPDTPGDGIETEHQTVAASEGSIQGVIKRLTESDNADVKALAEVVSGLHTQNQTLTAALHLSETNNLVQKLAEPKDGKALPAGVIKQLSETLLAPTADGVVKLMDAVRSSGGLISTTESPAGDKDRQENNGDATKQFNEKVKALMDSNDKIDYGSAVEQVSRDNPQLFADYRSESYAFKEN